jgi:hypothetical protein
MDAKNNMVLRSTENSSGAPANSIMRSAMVWRAAKSALSHIAPRRQTYIVLRDNASVLMTL